MEQNCSMWKAILFHIVCIIMIYAVLSWFALFWRKLDFVVSCEAKINPTILSVEQKLQISCMGTTKWHHPHHPHHQHHHQHHQHHPHHPHHHDHHQQHPHCTGSQADVHPMSICPLINRYWDATANPVLSSAIQQIQIQINRYWDATANPAAVLSYAIQQIQIQEQIQKKLQIQRQIQVQMQMQIQINRYWDPTANPAAALSNAIQHIHKYKYWTDRNSLFLVPFNPEVLLRGWT